MCRQQLAVGSWSPVLLGHCRRGFIVLLRGLPPGAGAAGVAGPPPSYYRSYTPGHPFCYSWLRGLLQGESSHFLKQPLAGERECRGPWDLQEEAAVASDLPVTTVQVTLHR